MAIEVISPDDSPEDILQRADDYAKMGVANIWLVDPLARTGKVLRDAQSVEVSEFVVRSTPIKITLAEFFAEFDQF